MNDDLGNFPKPPSLTTSSNNPTPPVPKEEPVVETPKTDEVPPQSLYTPPTFEPTPDEIFPPLESPKNILEDTKEVVKTETAPAYSEPKLEVFSAPSEPVMATTAPEIKSPTSSLITIVLLLVGGIGISGSVFLYSQSANLKKQLTDITKTLEQQRTIITPSPTPTIIDIPTPTPTKEASPEATITPTPTATPSGTVTLSTEAIPLALAPQALKVGINEEPNAQLILIKVDNAKDPEKLLIKYFFRKDLTTKKYFYVSINGKNESEINNNAIYVNPDNNIPSLNDQVLGNKLGIDFPEAFKIATDQCAKDQTLIAKCKELQTSAQYIQSGTTNIWQITLSTGNEKLIYQINSKTKEVLYKPTSK